MKAMEYTLLSFKDSTIICINNAIYTDYGVSNLFAPTLCKMGN